MLIVLPVCPKDIALAERNVAWMRRLEDRSIPFDCLIHAEEGTENKKLKELCESTFGRVHVNVYDRCPLQQTWPLPQNYAWQKAATHVPMFNDSWLWLEADATPLVRGWAQKLNTAYEEAGKPFAGHIVNGMGHMNGVAIYPPVVAEYCADALRVRTHPFDRFLSQYIKGSTTELNRLMGHQLKKDRESVHIDCLADAQALIDMGLVIFHGCADGSLLDCLVGVAPAPKVTLMQFLMKWRYGKGRFASTKEAIAKTISVLVKKPLPMIVHCLERHKPANQDEERRVGNAQNSWVNLYKTGRVKPAHFWEPYLGRNSEQLGDARCLPFLKDVLLAGRNLAKPDDIVMWTNDDTILHSQTPEVIVDYLSTREAVGSFRLNFEKDKMPLLNAPLSEVVRLGDGYDLGRDLFAFRKSWLIEHWTEIPDFLLGELEFDLALAFLIRKHAGVRTTKQNMDKVLDQCELPKGYVMHERHNRMWTSNAQAASAAKIHNRKLFAEFCSDNDLHGLINTRAL